MSGEYISRENITERLERVIEHGVPNTMGTHSITAEAALEVIRDIPAADVVEVVRCRKCYFRALDGADVPVCTGAMAYSYTPDDWFCADGKPKDGG